MLVLTRKSNQSIMIGDDIEVSVLSVMGEKVRIGIQAPQEVPVFRKEIYLEIHAKRRRGRRRRRATHAPRSTTRCASWARARLAPRRRPTAAPAIASPAAGRACGTSRP